jgi:hypothetical protein
VQRHFLFAVVLATAAACATPRKDLGGLQVQTLRPLTSTQLYDSTHFRIQEGRLFVVSPYAAEEFDIVEMDDGCLRGSSRSQQLIYCRVSDKPDADGTSHWRSVSNEISVFSTVLKEDGRILEIVTTTYRAQIELGKTPAENEVRKRPELLAAAFARGLFPAAKDEEDGDSGYHEIKYVVTK